MYTFPLQCLNNDDGVNNTFADLLESDMILWISMRKQFYRDVSPDSKCLHHLIQLYDEYMKMTLIWMRTRHDTYHGFLGDIIKHRCYIMTITTLSILRKIAGKIYSGFSDYLLMDNLMKDHLWDSGVNKFSDAVNWNTRVRDRFQDIHRHLFYFIMTGESLVLTKKSYPNAEELENTVAIVKDITHTITEYCQFTNSIVP